MRTVPSTASPEVSVVIPCYNEEYRLPRTLERFCSFLKERGLGCETIVVVEPGTDRTAECARSFAPAFEAIGCSLIVIENEIKRGKGYAVRTGILRATGRFCFFMDADLATELEAIPRFLEYFAANPATPMLIGSRRDPSTVIVERQSWLREKMGRTFNRIIRFLGVHSIKDTQCGFKAFRQEIVHSIFERASLNGFAFDVELLVLATRLGYPISELPVRWSHQERSSVRIVRDSLKMFWDLLWIPVRVHFGFSKVPMGSLPGDSLYSKAGTAA